MNSYKAPARNLTPVHFHEGARLSPERSSDLRGGAAVHSRQNIGIHPDDHLRLLVPSELVGAGDRSIA